MSDSSDGKLFYVTTIAFVLGVAANSVLLVNLAAIVWVGLIGLVLGLIGRRPGSAIFLIGLATGCFALGLLRFEWSSLKETNPTLEAQLNEEITLTGQIVREPEERQSSTHLYVKTEEGLVLVLARPGQDWRYGERVAATGLLERPEAFETDLGRTFDYRGYLLAKGIAYMVSRAEVEKISDGAGWWVIGQIYTLKKGFMTRLENLLPEPEVGLAEGLLLGVKRALGEELEATFRSTGIIHIVVLSGYNVMLVVLFILYVLRHFLGKRASTWFGLLAIAAFAIMVGLSATVVRASVMAALLLIIGLTGRVYLVLRGLMLAGVVMLLWNPYSLVFDAGFQLSFLATLGLIFVSPHLEKSLAFIPERFQVREFLIATLATQIFVLPILLYQIGEFSVVAVAVNVLVLPAVPIAMLLTFLTGLVAFLSPMLATPLAMLAYLPLWYIINTAEWFGALPFASFTMPAFSFWLVPVGYALLALILWRLNRRTSLEKVGT